MDRLKKPTLSVDITIIGGGLAGLSLACGLSHIDNSLSIHIFEKRSKFSEAGATFGLALNGIKALNKITPGLMNTLRTEGIDMPNGGLMLPWWKVRDALLLYTKQHSNIQFHMNEEIMEFDEKMNEVIVSFKSGLTIKSSLLVAADGFHSHVRHLLKLPAAIKTGKFIWRGRLICPNPDQEPFQSILQNGIVPLGLLTDKSTNSSFMAFNFHAKEEGLIAWTFVRQIDQKSIEESKLSCKEFIIDTFKYQNHHHHHHSNQNNSNNADLEITRQVSKQFQQFCHVINQTPDDQILQSTQYIINMPPILSATPTSTTSAAIKKNDYNNSNDNSNSFIHDDDSGLNTPSNSNKSSITNHTENNSRKCIYHVDSHDSHNSSHNYDNNSSISHNYDNSSIIAHNYDNSSIATSVSNTDSYTTTSTSSPTSKAETDATIATTIANGWGGTGRVTLIGDAAHAMHSADGQGGSQAFEDCVIFCRVINHSNGNGPNGCKGNTMMNEDDKITSSFDFSNIKNDEINDSVTTIHHHDNNKQFQNPSRIKEVLANALLCKQFITEFESTRLPRVRIIHDNQRHVTRERVNGCNSQWAPEFAKWVYDGV